jgi:acetyl esterase/lipase
MKSMLIILAFITTAAAQVVKKDIRYLEDGHARHVLDVYAPAGAKDLPVLFWIHGGGWQAGDKSSVDHKPEWFMEKGFVLVSTNYRLLPEVDMGTLIRDVAAAFGWLQSTSPSMAVIRNACSWPVTVPGRSSRPSFARMIAT